jgi:hypothetical protein
MDFLTILSYVLAVVETAALLGALVFATRAMHENKLKRKHQGKKGAKSADEVDKNIAVYKRNATIFLMIYLALNVFRNYSGIFQ